jgi:hypothetical protein
MPFSIRPYRCFPMQCALLVPLCALAVLVTDIPSAIGQPSTLPSYIFDGGADYIYAQGTWIWDTPSRDPYWRDYALQTSEINCYRVRKTCLEARALWKDDMMLSSLLEYNIREWDQGKVIAVLDGAAATIELRFDLKNQVVLLTHTEKPELPNPRKLPAYAHLDDGMKAIEKAKGK